MPRNIRAALRQHPIPDSDSFVLKMVSKAGLGFLFLTVPRELVGKSTSAHTF